MSPAMVGADAIGYDILDLVGPYRGPCGICGGRDARHRLADALVGYIRAGDSPEMIVEIYEDYRITAEVLAALVAHAERNRKRRRARWSHIPTPKAHP